MSPFDTCTCGHVRDDHNTYGECGANDQVGAGPVVKCSCIAFELESVPDDGRTE